MLPGQHSLLQSGIPFASSAPRQNSLEDLAAKRSKAVTVLCGVKLKPNSGGGWSVANAAPAENRQAPQQFKSADEAIATWFSSSGSDTSPNTNSSLNGLPLNLYQAPAGPAVIASGRHCHHCS